ncbi:hypothetical protein CEXT_725581 [Caerostris extrusa]|uniref:Uncharacterized protein n=1 Tax=Caerostris extrusa TaxID=172846 RepID=A0AAV4X8U0_CAEEX|nr:hypothetical protein CEXT_725581 [Caerostris extrusa]
MVAIPFSPNLRPASSSNRIEFFEGYLRDQSVKMVHGKKHELINNIFSKSASAINMSSAIKLSLSLYQLAACVGG